MTETKLVKTFTFLTYNLDQSQFNFEERLAAFFKLIKINPPDIVVIQEGTRLTYEKLLREMGNMGYKRNLLDIMHHRSCGEMIFSKFPVSDIKYIEFKRSSGNRGLVIQKIDMWGRYVWIITSQFDDKISLQRQQISDLSVSLKHLNLKENIIFGGDTRILNYQKDLVAPVGWYDAWYESGTDDSQYTLDGTKNLLVDDTYKDRPDMIWFRPGINKRTNKVINGSVECVDCVLYGDKSNVTVSSHYGVLAKFKFV